MVIHLYRLYYNFVKIIYLGLYNTVTHLNFLYLYLPYTDLLLDHYHHPRNKGLIPNPNFSSDLINPSCGDQVIIQGYVQNNIITHCSFEGKGCVISIAAASLLTTLVIGKTIIEALAITPQTLLSEMHITLGPTRLRCALLSLEALHTALNKKA